METSSCFSGQPSSYIQQLRTSREVHPRFARKKLLFCGKRSASSPQKRPAYDRLILLKCRGRDCPSHFICALPEDAFLNHVFSEASRLTHVLCPPIHLKTISRLCCNQVFCVAFRNRKQQSFGTAAATGRIIDEMAFLRDDDKEVLVCTDFYPVHHGSYTIPSVVCCEACVQY